MPGTTVELTNFLERNALTRRTLLAGAGSFLAAAALSGCGGLFANGGGATSSAFTSITGLVTLPAGSSASLVGAQVLNALTSSPVSTAAAYTSKVSSVLPSLLYVVDSAEKVILLGYVNPATNTTTINSTSTAIALLHFALQGYSLPESELAQFHALMIADPAVATLATVIETRLGASYTALEDDDSTINNAVIAAVQAILPPTAMSPVLPSTRSREESQTDALQNLMIIEPSAKQSGFEVLQNTAGEGLIGINNYRRYAQVYFYQTSTTDQNGVVTDTNPPRQVGEVIHVPSTKNLSLFNALSAPSSTQYPYDPVRTSPVILDLPSNTKRATFDAVVIGSSFNLDDPAVFRDPKYSSQTDNWKAQVTELSLRSFVVDVMFRVFLDALGAGAMVTADTVIDRAIADVIAIEDAAFVEVIALGKSGRLGPAIAKAFQALARNEQLTARVYAILEKVVADAAAAAGIASSGARELLSVQMFAKSILKVLLAVGGVASVIDIAAVERDLNFSNKADVWSITIEPPSLPLDPTAVTANKGAEVILSAGRPTGVTGTITYDWTQTSPYAQFRDQNGKVGSSVTSATSQVSLLTSLSENAPITVTVKAFVVDGSRRTEVGTATCRITFFAQQPLPLTIAMVTSKPFLQPDGRQVINFYQMFSWSQVTGAKNYRILDQNAGYSSVFDPSIFLEPSPPFVDPVNDPVLTDTRFHVGAPRMTGSGLFKLNETTFALINTVYPHTFTAQAGYPIDPTYLKRSQDTATYWTNYFGNLTKVFSIM